ncbi:hypothetical protein TNCV_3005811 [Trichonephila clavipes]|nr:hypothetical protein TNCV_3005811 [Trichonephila clavipes]
MVTNFGMKVHVGEICKWLESQRDCALPKAERRRLTSFSREYKTSNQIFLSVLNRLQTRRVARQLDHSDYVVKEVLGPVDARYVIYAKTGLGTPSTDQSSGKLHIARNARVQPTASSSAIQLKKPLGERLNPAFALQRHTVPTAGVMAKQSYFVQVTIVLSSFDDRQIAHVELFFHLDRRSVLALSVRSSRNVTVPHFPSFTHFLATERIILSMTVRKRFDVSYQVEYQAGDPIKPVSPVLLINEPALIYQLLTNYLRNNGPNVTRCGFQVMVRSWVMSFLTQYSRLALNFSNQNLLFVIKKC